MKARTLTARLDELQAEVERLRLCIKDAPHDSFCGIDAAPVDFPDKMRYCDCWKREALFGPDKEGGDDSTCTHVEAGHDCPHYPACGC